jgi:hypothetical protein
MGGEPAHRTNLGDQDFLSGLSPLAFGVSTPLLQGNKICNPRQGPLQGAICRSQPNPVFFFEVVTPSPPPFSTGLGTGYGGVIFLNSVSNKTIFVTSFSVHFTNQLIDFHPYRVL